MKYDRLRAGLVALLLAFFLAWGCTGCLISAFDLKLQYPSVIGLVCGIGAAGTALLLCARRGGILLLGLWMLAAGYICHDGMALEQLKSLITQLSIVYDRAYKCGVLFFDREPILTEFVDWPLWIWSILISAAVCSNVCRQKSVWIPVLVTVMPLCSCVVVTDTVPEEVFLLMVMAGLFLLILTSYVRQENAAQGDRLLIMAALPVVLTLTGLFLVIPQESYVNHSAVLRENILTGIRYLPQLLENRGRELVSGLGFQLMKEVELSALGDRIPFSYPVMEVTAEQNGTLYLRGQDYDQYDGLGWKVSENRMEFFQSTEGQTETIHIQTKTGKRIRYLPYHPVSAAELINGSAENPQRERSYTVLRNVLPEDWRKTACESPVDTPVQWQVYCSLPEATRQGAAIFLERLYAESDSYTEKADMIAALVIDSARYDTSPEKMPAGESDFALWFLREGDTGYCVHFATAAAVLLRAAGVPARYVTGYLLEAKAGETVTVTEENAHAWAEYYEPNLGVWIPLEATPTSAAPVQMLSAPIVSEAAEHMEAEPDRLQSAIEQEEPEKQHPGAVAPVLPVEPEAEGTDPAAYLIMFPAAVLFLILQRSARLAFHRERRISGNTNQQALRRWQEAVRLSRLLKETPTEELMALAQKAKFSQYTITPEELGQFDSFIRSCLRRLKERPWHLRLVYRYICCAF